MKRLFLLLALPVLIGCSKDDIKNWLHKSRCQISEQSFADGAKPQDRHTTVKKTFNSDGSVETLTTDLRNDWGMTVFDSIQYAFEYGNNTVQVDILATYEGGLTRERSSIVVHLDPKTKYATRVGDDVVVYHNNRVISFGTHQFEYDGQGNLISIDKGEERAVSYQYDLTKKAGKYDFYATDNTNTLGINLVLAMIMRWIPTQSPNRRTAEYNSRDGLIESFIQYKDHRYSSDGKLIEFAENPNASGRFYPVQNVWKCD
jgi:YD repeat-containing protein